MNYLSRAREGSGRQANEVNFSICTIANDLAQYEDMLASFHDNGFTRENSEFLYIDNSRGNRFDCYEGLNHLMAQCRGTFLILCHQDIRLLQDGAEKLLLRLSQLEELDSLWAVAGNAGKDARGKLKICITDMHGKARQRGNLPERVVSLDENFLVVKRDALLGFSDDLSGFHIYGTDLCVQADVRGRSAYVIDFHLEHLGRGGLSPAFFKCVDAFEVKYASAFKKRRIRTTCTKLVAGVTKAGLIWQRMRRERKKTRFSRKVQGERK